MARPFKEIQISNCSSQPREQRFPSLDELFGSQDFGEEPQHLDVDEEGQPPHIAEWRSNLVALSQRFNLYFSAFQDKIHASVPRDLKQTLQGDADLVIELPVSEQAGIVSGVIDFLRPHCVNNMTVGNLGTHEILLMGCDDGDVLAYYTHTIWHAVESMRKSGGAGYPIAPLFHENVGLSAWGLAIHQQSRVIAVSSNNREVTVFVPAYTVDGGTTQIIPRLGYPEFRGTGVLPTDNRESPYRKILQLGPESHNIPSIDFASDVAGEAQSILAVDIKGNLWIVDIWESRRLRIPTIHRGDPIHDGQMGWSVLSIPLSAFKKTETPQEALGMRNIHDAFAVGQLGQTSKTYFNVKGVRAETVAPHLTSALTLEAENDDAMDLSDGSELVSGNGEDARDLAGEENSVIETRPPTQEEDEIRMFWGLREWRQFPSTSTARTLLSSKYISEPFKLALVSNQEVAAACFRHIVNMPASVANSIKSFDDLAKLLAQHMEPDVSNVTLPVVEDQTGDKDQPMYLLRDKSAVIRTYEFDVELIPASLDMPRSLFRGVVKRNLPPDLEVLGRSERLCFTKLIPELSLAAIGSQVGRVALISLTSPQISSRNGPALNFRLECILPRKQEEDEGLRPNLPLLGMAVGPLQAAKEGSGNRRWRIFLHYYDHSVLSYEISRDDDFVLEVF